MAMEVQRAYDITEVASILGVSRDTVYRAVRRDELPSFRFGGKLLIVREAVDSLVNGDGKERGTHAATTNSSN